MTEQETLDIIDRLRGHGWLGQRLAVEYSSECEYRTGRTGKLELVWRTESSGDDAPLRSIRFVGLATDKVDHISALQHVATIWNEQRAAVIKLVAAAYQAGKEARQ